MRIMRKIRDLRAYRDGSRQALSTRRLIVVVDRPQVTHAEHLLAELHGERHQLRSERHIETDRLHASAPP
jgi:hypothetical protein